MHSWRFVCLVSLFVTALVTANIVAVKLVSFGSLVVPAAIVVFPVSYILGDVLTEVYGYRTARRVIWLGFLCNLIVVLVIAVTQALPPAPFWAGDQAAYERILGATPRFLAASFLAYVAGEFSNAFVLARLKLATRGRWLWLRTISSTLVGQGLDSAIFITLAFAGTVSGEVLAVTIVTQWSLKVAYEAAATPLTYLVVNALKRLEHQDVYDWETNFNPLGLGT